jgi:molybdenum cofactor biosynthesis enzyme MoaA
MLLIAEVKKNSRELVRISLGTFKGHEICDVRCHYPTASGDWLPTPKGLTFSVDLLQEILEALKMASEKHVVSR